MEQRVSLALAVGVAEERSPPRTAILHMHIHDEQLLPVNGDARNGRSTRLTLLWQHDSARLFEMQR